MRKFVKFFIEYFFLFYLTIFFRLFPLTIALKIATYLGKLFFYINHTHRKRAINNLIRAFPEKDYQKILRICKQVYINLAKVFMEFIFLPKIDRNYVNRKVKVIGEENLKEALKKKKGIVAVTGHIGNWELLGTIVVKIGYPLAAIYHPMKNPYSDKLFYKIRSATGMELIPMKDSLRGSIKALKENKLIGLIADQDAGDAGIFVDFFGTPASTAKGPAVFAVKTKAPMIFFTLIRGENDTHTLYISKPLKVKITGNLDNDIYYNTKLWSDELEKWVRKYPEQWFWVHRRWHTKKKS